MHAAVLGLKPVTKPKHPWTNGQVERMNRTIKDATVKRFYYESHNQLRQYLADFAPQTEGPQRPHALRKHLQNLDATPDRFNADPTHQMPGLNI